jgi:hypothetical protein
MTKPQPPDFVASENFWSLPLCASLAFRFPAQGENSAVRPNAQTSLGEVISCEGSVALPNSRLQGAAPQTEPSNGHAHSSARRRNRQRLAGARSCWCAPKTQVPNAHSLTDRQRPEIGLEVPQQAHQSRPEQQPDCGACNNGREIRGAQVSSSRQWRRRHSVSKFLLVERSSKG